MIAYYVDPGDSEFAKAGLGFTTDSETGFIGFHSEGTYSRMISDNYAIMGLRLFCEYLDAIAYISVGESDTQTLGTLSGILADIKKICRSIEHTAHYAWNMQRPTQRILPDNTTKQPLLMGVLVVGYKFS